ncbi:hypothetical protein EVAR_13626_1 [Eumeta japonica]|uniref:Uncharacterized protein n=1 Tax=Eumeta variegata TaxID=151549 RepID=A0A4C1UTA6_EUMVA|nr:hypothetical protein EVAR_13626_1 [Eumeta japonica]
MGPVAARAEGKGAGGRGKGASTAIEPHHSNDQELYNSRVIGGAFSAFWPLKIHQPTTQRSQFALDQSILR